MRIFLVGAGNTSTGILHTLHYYLRSFGMKLEDIR